MPVSAIRSSTGAAVLPDIGTLAYNGVTFSQLYKSSVNGNAIPDAASRTVRFMEYTITVEGMVTLNDGDVTTDNSWVNLRQRLDQYAGTLTYQGKGFGPLVVNKPGGVLWDVNWGPKPQTLEFQPLGSSRSAMIRWTVKVCIPELQPGEPLPVFPFPPGIPSSPGGSPGDTLPGFPPGIPGGGGSPGFPPGIPGGGGGLGRTRAAGLGAAGGVAGAGGVAIMALIGPVIQHNNEISISYDEDQYSSINIRGTLEIPITRRTVTDRSIPYTVDDYRQAFLDFAGAVDLTRFRVSKRSFHVSRDRRTCEWELTIDELPPMGIPPGSTTARGRMTVRPWSPTGKGTNGLVSWMMSLRCTYTIRKDFPRRMAWAAFIALLKYRMEQYTSDMVPKLTGKAATDSNPLVPSPGSYGFWRDFIPAPLRVQTDALKWARDLLAGEAGVSKRLPAKFLGARLWHFGYDEGLYLDSKTITFEASWFAIFSFAYVLRATGLWNWLPGSVGGTNWSISMQDITGWKGVLDNRINSAAEAIVDLGGP